MALSVARMNPYSTAEAPGRRCNHVHTVGDVRCMPRDPSGTCIALTICSTIYSVRTGDTDAALSALAQCRALNEQPQGVTHYSSRIKNVWIDHCAAQHWAFERAGKVNEEGRWRKCHLAMSHITYLSKKYLLLQFANLSLGRCDKAH